MNEIIQDYLRIFLSWPSVVLTLVAIFYFKFTDEVSSLLDRLKTLPGGIGLSDSQASRIKKEEITRAAPEPVSNNVLSEPRSRTPEVTPEALEGERATQMLWEFRYLNFYLINTTQSVLDWFVGFGRPVPATFYDSHWMVLIADSNERNAIVSALANHHLIQLDGNGQISVTPKGRQYQEWRGPLPNSVSGQISNTIPRVTTHATGTATTSTPNPNGGD